MARENYLNNRDLMKEIHKSKNSYCSLSNEKYHMYDIIYEYELPEITEELIAEWKQKRAERLTREKIRDQRLNKIPTKNIDISPVSTDDINHDDLTIRLKTFDHIPELEIQKKNIKKISDKYIRLNFPPFKNFTIDYLDGEYSYREVGRSHWEGSIGNGYFCQTHGRMTPKLGHMISLLVHRYSQKGNWRNYTYNDEMVCQANMQLSDVGLKFDESKSDNPFAYYTTISRNAFFKILNDEKQSQRTRDDILVNTGNNPSYTRQVEHEFDIHRKEYMEAHGQVDKPFVPVMRRGRPIQVKKG